LPSQEGGDNKNGDGDEDEDEGEGDEEPPEDEIEDILPPEDEDEEEDDEEDDEDEEEAEPPLSAAAPAAPVAHAARPKKKCPLKLLGSSAQQAYRVAAAAATDAAGRDSALDDAKDNFGKLSEMEKRGLLKYNKNSLVKVGLSLVEVCRLLSTDVVDKVVGVVSRSRPVWDYLISGEPERLLAEIKQDKRGISWFHENVGACFSDEYCYDWEVFSCVSDDPVEGIKSAITIGHCVKVNRCQFGEMQNDSATANAASCLVEALAQKELGLSTLCLNFSNATNECSCAAEITIDVSKLKVGVRERCLLASTGLARRSLAVLAACAIAAHANDLVRKHKLESPIDMAVVSFAGIDLAEILQPARDELKGVCRISEGSRTVQHLGYVLSVAEIMKLVGAGKAFAPLLPEHEILFIFLAHRARAKVIDVKDKILREMSVDDLLAAAKELKILNNRRMVVGRSIKNGALIGTGERLLLV